MDIIIVCHTEFGFVYRGRIVFDKRAKQGVRKGSQNLANLAEKYGAKITFALCPEATEFFPKNISHEVGLHIHPGWQERRNKKFKWVVGDAYLKNHCQQSINSTVLRDYSFQEQLEMIKWGEDYLESNFNREIKTFVAGRWSVNDDTVKALIQAGITHDCSATPHSQSDHSDWSKLERICLPYYPGKDDYQKKGKLPLLIVPISQFFPAGNVNIEAVPDYGLSWLKACFSEYYKQGVPLFHICLHSPAMTNSYFLSAMDEFLRFIAGHQKVNFKFASEIKKYPERTFHTNILPYFFALNHKLIKRIIKKIWKRKKMKK